MDICNLTCDCCALFSFSLIFCKNYCHNRLTKIDSLSEFMKESKNYLRGNFFYLLSVVHLDFRGPHGPSDFKFAMLKNDEIAKWKTAMQKNNKS